MLMYALVVNPFLNKFEGNTSFWLFLFCQALQRESCCGAFQDCNSLLHSCYLCRAGTCGSWSVDKRISCTRGFIVAFCDGVPVFFNSIRVFQSRWLHGPIQRISRHVAARFSLPFCFVVTLVYHDWHSRVGSLTRALLGPSSVHVLPLQSKASLLCASSH